MFLLSDGTPVPDRLRGSVLAIGNFDGMHRGHHMVLDAARHVADPDGHPLGVMTFEPHPRQVFRPDDPPFRLTDADQRRDLLRAEGIDLLVERTFDHAFSQLSAETFIERVLVGELAVRHIAVGYDFRFGHGRAGDATTLTQAGGRLGFGVTVVTQAADESGGVYSSSRARELIQQGDMAGAAEILGRPWSVRGPVLHGDKRGRTLDFPTANVALGPLIRPRFGVYAVRVRLPDGQSRDGVANVGIRPMWQTDTPMVEAHLFDFAGDLYDQTVEVALIARLRGEARFDSAEALVEQMHRDAEDARRALRQAG
jgi:riboflavin kinase/FMN adenylyltransferase